MAQTVAPRPGQAEASLTIELNEGQRQLLLLALAHLAVARPGWNYACHEIALKANAAAGPQSLFERFKDLAASAQRLGDCGGATPDPSEVPPPGMFVQPADLDTIPHQADLNAGGPLGCICLPCVRARLQLGLPAGRNARKEK